MILFLQCLGLLYVIIGIFMAMAAAIELQTGLYKSTVSLWKFIQSVVICFFFWPLIVCVAFLRNV